jgi:glycosyltransferase involved in cell wall biosynthesis
MKISVTIITLNEEANLERALKSCDFAHEIVVVDSFSTDRTVEIAKKYRALVFQKEFIGYGQQKNFAADQTSGDWILNIDADEEVSPLLKEELIKISKDPQAKDLYAIDRLTSFGGQWIHYGGWSPDYVNRFCRRGTSLWTSPHVHENLELLNPNKKIGRISFHLLHYSFPNVESQIRTNLKFAKLGAKELLQKNSQRPAFLMIILKPLGKFIECFIYKKGFLDGQAGLIIAINAMHSIFLKYVIARELAASKRELS